MTEGLCPSVRSIRQRIRQPKQEPTAEELKLQEALAEYPELLVQARWQIYKARTLRQRYYDIAIIDEHDLVQTAYLGLVRTRVEHVEDVPAYLSQALRNAWKNAIVRGQNYERYIPRPQEGMPEWTIDDVPDVTDMERVAEVSDWLATALRELPERERTAWLLAEVYGYQRPAIAGILGISISSVRDALREAREALP